MSDPGIEVIPNIPRVYTALAEWCGCLIMIPRSPVRQGLTRGKQGLIVALFLPAQCTFLQLTGHLSLGWWIPCMAAAVCLQFLMLYACTALPVTAMVYATARAFLLAEFAAALEWQLWYYGSARLGVSGSGPALLFLAAVYGANFSLMFFLDRRSVDLAVLRALRPLDLWVPLGIALVSFLMGNLSFVLSNTPFSATSIVDLHTIRTLVDFAGLVSLFSYHQQICRRHDREELNAIQNLLHAQYAQYQLSRESIDMIHRKYHDLKHQIAVLRAETDPARRSAFLNDMEQEIRTFEAQNKTGNPVLDTVLTGKSLLCVRSGIELTCVADGSLLSFMSAMDLSTLFGNILDNAIEYEETLPDPKQRLIHLTVTRKSRMLVIRCENYCPNPPEPDGTGLFRTSKGDTEQHGYGLKSIRFTAERYGGSMAVSVHQQWFCLTVLLPLPAVENP